MVASPASRLINRTLDVGILLAAFHFLLAHHFPTQAGEQDIIGRLTGFGIIQIMEIGSPENSVFFVEGASLKTNFSAPRDLPTCCTPTTQCSFPHRTTITPTSTTSLRIVSNRKSTLNRSIEKLIIQISRSFIVFAQLLVFRLIARRLMYSGTRLIQAAQFIIHVTVLF